MHKNIIFSKRLTKKHICMYRHRISRNKYSKNTKILRSSNKRVQLLGHGIKVSTISRWSKHRRLSEPIALTLTNVDSD